VKRGLLLVTLAMPMAVSAAPVAIVHARVWTMLTATPVGDATVLLDGGKIVSVTAGDVPPPAAVIVDAHGRTVTPGLMNGGTQLGLAEVANEADTDDRSVASGPLGAAFDVAYAINPNSVQLPVARADGLTRAMLMPGGAAVSPFTGLGAVIHLVPSGDIVERARAAVFVTVGEATLDRAGGSRAAQWVLLRNALDEARVLAGRAPSLAPRDQLLSHLDAAALIPVLARTVPLAIAANRESDIRQAIRLAADYHVRVIIVGGVEAWCAATELAAAAIPVVLDPEADLPQNFDQLGARLDNAAILNRAGVAIAFTVSGNTIYLSYDAGLALREGAGIAVANGLPYAAALRAVTVAPARIWSAAPLAGVLAAGAPADLVIWDGDPLEPSSAPVAVYVKGRAVSLRTRQTELRDRYAPSHAGDPLPPGYPVTRR